MNTIAQKINEQRKLKGLTQEELAEKATLSLRTIQRIENEESEPRGKTLQLICEALELDLTHVTQQKPSGKDWIALFFRLVYLLLLNLAIILIYGNLTFSQSANMNSRFGGLLLSFFLPFFLVVVNPKTTPSKRLLNFGTGVFLYGLIPLFLGGAIRGFVTWLDYCLILHLIILYFGDSLIPKNIRST